MLREAARTLFQSEPSLRFVTPFLSAHPNAELFLVGGAVRDLLLARPTADFDFVVRQCPPGELEAWFATQGRVDLVGRDFGVYKFLPETLRPEEYEFIDLALPRTETVRKDSRGGYREFQIESDPDISIQDDLSRRDFTVNAMALNCDTQELVDPFHGQEDLDARLIRAVGNPEVRFEEDLSRMLRAIRFAAELVFRIEEKTWEALMAHIDGLARTRTNEEGKEEYVVPRETVGKELAKALSADPEKTLVLLKEADAFRHLIPAIAPLVENDHDYLDPIFHHPSPVPTVTTALFLRALSPKDAASAVRALGLHTLPTASPLHVNPADVAWMIEQIRDMDALEKAIEAPGAKFETMFMNGRAGMFIPFLRALGKEALVAGALARRDHILSIWNVEHHKHIPRLVSGDDILSLGVKPGPRIRELLNAVRNKQLDGSIKRREQALAFLKEQLTS